MLDNEERPGVACPDLDRGPDEGGPRRGLIGTSIVKCLNALALVPGLPAELPVRRLVHSLAGEDKLGQKLGSPPARPNASLSWAATLSEQDRRDDATMSYPSSPSMPQQRPISPGLKMKQSSSIRSTGPSGDCSTSSASAYPCWSGRRAAGTGVTTAPPPGGWEDACCTTGCSIGKDTVASSLSASCFHGRSLGMESECQGLRVP